ncbi:hypothetical protein BGS_1279 [Beggiatoa sp. SS]|nr:hypothetical protein BGS_1279 [Beggiatoa sp. SS]
MNHKFSGILINRSNQGATTRGMLFLGFFGCHHTYTRLVQGYLHYPLRALHISTNITWHAGYPYITMRQARGGPTVTHARASPS